MINVVVDRFRAVVEFDFEAAWDEEGAWREALEAVAEMGPAAVMEGLSLVADLEAAAAEKPAPAKRGARRRGVAA